MTTHKGRVVYDRKPHLFTEKDIARITKQAAAEKGPRELAKLLWGIDVEVVKLQVWDEALLIEFVSEFLALVFAWAKDIGSWLWDMILSWLGLEPSPPEEEIPPEEPENGGENASS